MISVLAAVNDVFQAIVVIFSLSVALFYTRYVKRDAVARAFALLLGLVGIVYLTELLAGRAVAGIPAATWLRAEWVGIALVPAALHLLATALLRATGTRVRRPRGLVAIDFAIGIAFLVAVVGSDLVVGGGRIVSGVYQLEPGPLFVVFAIYFWAISLASSYAVFVARSNSLTRVMRRRMGYVLASFLAAPLGVFPYLLVGFRSSTELGVGFWLTIVAGNVAVGVLFGLLTYQLAYFGASATDRVVRVRIFKYMARVPLAATLVFLAGAVTLGAGSVLGLDPGAFVILVAVGTVILVEWAIHALKPQLERWFRLTDDPEVRRIQMLSERMLTSSDLQQFFESVLSATCELLRTETAFVTSMTSDGPALEAAIGPLVEPEELLKPKDLKEIGVAVAEAESSSSGTMPKKVGDFYLWQNFWISKLESEESGELVGLMGVRASSASPGLSGPEREQFAGLRYQLTKAMEDRLLQRDVFAAVEGLLPEVAETQRKRRAAVYGRLTEYSASTERAAASEEFEGLVRDALRHYWGGPKLVGSPLTRLEIVETELGQSEGSRVQALRSILARAIELQKPSGTRKLTTAEWILYNILELKFVKGLKVRDVAGRLAMSESDLYRKQRVAIENVANTLLEMEQQQSGATSEELLGLLEGNGTLGG